MALTEYDYHSTDFPNQKCNLDSLELEIAAKITAGDIVGVLNHIDKHDQPPPDDLCCIWFDDALDAASKAELDAVVAAHQGNPPLQVQYHATASLVEEKAILDTQDWDYLASAVTHPQFFVPDLSKFIGKVVGACKTNGLGSELRVLEDSATHIMGSFALPDTGGEWAQFQFYSTSIPTVGSHEYIIEGRLDGATSAEIRGTSMTILENITPPEGA
jgi:hypothetical protein